MKSQLNEIKRMQQLAGILKEEIGQPVIDFLDSHIDEVKKYMINHLVFDRLGPEEVEKRKNLVNSVQKFVEDGNGDATPDKEIGVSFRFAEDIDKDPSFYEEEGDPKFFNLAGKKMVAIWYN